MKHVIKLIAENPKLPGLAIFIICAVALSIAFTAEYGFAIEPCELCLYQRLPYVAAGLFALFAIIAKPGGVTHQLALLGCGLAFCVGMALAIYHFGVEERWWAASCAGTQAMDLSFEDLKAAIMAEPLKPCDQRNWVIFGLSITVYNTLFSLFMALSTFTALVIIRKLKAATPPSA